MKQIEGHWLAVCFGFMFLHTYCLYNSSGKKSAFAKAVILVGYTRKCHKV